MAQQKYLNNCLLQIDTFIENSADSMKSSKDKAEFLLEKLQEAYKIVFINIDGKLKNLISVTLSMRSKIPKNGKTAI